MHIVIRVSHNDHYTPKCIWGTYLGAPIWSSGVSLKRSCKMHFICLDLVSIGPIVKSYDQISFLALQSGGRKPNYRSIIISHNN